MREKLNRENIIQTLADHSRQLSGYGVKRLGLFGSYASGRAHEQSDIDLLVDIASEKKTFQNFMRLNYYLEELLGNKVELVTIQSLSPYIGPKILKTVAYVPLAD